MGQDISLDPAQFSGNANLGINKPADVEWEPHKTYMLSFSGKPDSYGRPPEGSKTEARAIRASKHINKEICTLLNVIRNIGEKDPQTDESSITFGKLFSYYESMSNKVVGLLLRARRWRLVDFPGEMLYQTQDDHVLVRLLVDESRIPPSQFFQKKSSSHQNCEVTQQDSSISSSITAEIETAAETQTVAVCT